MGMCKECGEVYNFIDMTDGVCKYCLMPEEERIQIKDEEAKKYQEEKERKYQEEVQQYPYKSIMVTTETMIGEFILDRKGIVSAERVYGINFFKDFFSAISDIIGGRINNLESALKDSKKGIIEDLQKQAYSKGCNAVIGVRIEHTYNNSGSGNILSMFGTGTVVKLKQEE